MKTSCWDYKGLGRVAICRSTPRGGAPAGYRMFKALAPGAWFNTTAKPEYERLYQDEILGKLDPQKVWDDLHKLTGGAEPVLLCWEKPPLTETNFCHRRMVADWFENALGVFVPELGFEMASRQQGLHL